MVNPQSTSMVERAVGWQGALDPSRFCRQLPSVGALSLHGKEGAQPMWRASTLLERTSGAPLACPVSGNELDRSLCLGGDGFRVGQRERDPGSAAWPLLRPYPTPVRFHEPTSNREPEAGAPI